MQALGSVLTTIPSALPHAIPHLHALGIVWSASKKLHFAHTDYGAWCSCLGADGDAITTQKVAERLGGMQMCPTMYGGGVQWFAPHVPPRPRPPKNFPKCLSEQEKVNY